MKSSSLDVRDGGGGGGGVLPSKEHRQLSHMKMGKGPSDVGFSLIQHHKERLSQPK